MEQGISNALYVNMCKLHDKCSNLNLKPCRYTEYNSYDFEANIDPDSNFYNAIHTKCMYYTDEQFTNKFKNISGLFIIHLSCRSLK